MVDRRGGDVLESPSVSDFEDYTRLYLDSWTQPALRWLYSTLPSAMIFDDHELVDNWDISAAWVAEKRASPGWDARLSGALMSYWIYQHLGNLAPDELASDRLYQAVLRDGDGSERLRTHVREYDSDHSGSRWAYRRDFGDIRLLVLDTRATRVLEEGHRDMLDPAEWRWLKDNITGARHLLIASSVPVVYALGFHQLQAWSEHVAAGLWGSRAAGFAERLRRTLSLSGWPSFGVSFSRLVSLLAALGSGRLGQAPESITLLSGDVHHGYVARLHWPRRDGVTSAVHQVVTSPFRNPLLPHERLAQRFAASTLGARLLGLLARSAGVPPVELRWRRLEGIDFANQISTLRLDDGGVELRTEAAEHVRAGDGRAAGGTPGQLRTLWRRRLA
jgi:phosphodiesterase/alkaline phosphatase D-like protein